MAITGSLALYFATSIGLMLLARFLLKTPSFDQASRSDDYTSPISTRNVRLPYVLGTQEVSPVVGWVEEPPITKQENLQTGDVGGGKGLDSIKPGGIDDIETTVYYAHGWHMLCLGPASAIRKITQDGNVIWEGVITPESLPSGTAFEIEGQGTLRIYWGHADQPLSPLPMRQATGIQSRYPYVCYIFWERKRLGPSPKWPNLSYVVEVLCEDDTDGLDWSPRVATDSGYAHVNPASTLHRLLTGEYPHGAGMPLELIDKTSLTRVGTEIGDTEQIGNSFMIESGEKVADFFEAFLSEMGIAMPVHPEGHLMFLPVRSGDTTTTLTLEHVGEKDPETVIPTLNDTDQITRVAFEYNDSGRNFRINEIDFTNDALAGTVGVYNPETVTMRTIGNRTLARKIANRRISEFFSPPAKIDYSLFGEPTRLLPGQRVIDPSGRSCLMLSTQPNPLRGYAKASFAVDGIGASPEDNNDGTDDGPVTIPAAAQEDYAFKPVELAPTEYVGNGNSVEIVVLRLRANEYQAGSLITHEIAGSGNFSALGVQAKSCSGGPLLGAITSGTTTITEGPEFEAVNDDILELPDLTSRTEEWQAGEIIAFINNEVMFVQSIEGKTEMDWAASTSKSEGAAIIPTNGPTHRRFVALNTGLTGSTEPVWPSTRGERVVDGEVIWECRLPRYQLKGLIRQRKSTTAQAHEVGDTVYLTRPTSLKSFTAPAMQSGEVVAIKSLPYTSSDYLPSSLVEAAEITLAGAAGMGAQKPDLFVNGSGDYYINDLGERYEYDPERN